MDALDGTRYRAQIAIHDLLSAPELQIANNTITLKVRNPKTGTTGNKTLVIGHFQAIS
jgi:hypothetical protein